MKQGYAAQLFTIVQSSKRAVSYSQAAKVLKAANPQLKDTEKNTIGVKNILERFVVNGKMNKNRGGNYLITQVPRETAN